MGLRPKFTQQDIDNYVEDFYKEKEAKLIETLEFVGEGFIREARLMNKDQGGFGDVTGNLRSSIGYFITKNGVVIKEAVELSQKGSDRHTGLGVAKGFIHAIKSNSGLMVYGIAGMDYAEELESRGYNVITAQSDMAAVELMEILNRLK